MMHLLLIQLPPSTTSALFKLMMIEVLRVVLPSGIGGIDTKGNAPIGSVENINTLDPPPLGV
jgi:hypothetical protein